MRFPCWVFLTMACGALPASAADTQKTPVAVDTPASAPRAFSRGGINLARASWFVSAALDPSADAARIQRESTPTTPTVTIQTEPKAAATLFALIDLPDPAGRGGMVTIGDINGNDETFFNGAKIGETRGTGITDNGIPRVYYIEPKLLKSGRNVLALRLSAVSGAGGFGIRREPLTFGFASVPPRSPAYAAPKPVRGVTAIPEAEARAAIAALDGARLAESSEPLMRKRPSFGRFGMFFHDGLPMVTEVSPARIVQRAAPQIDVLIDSAANLSIAADGSEPGIDGWHKLARMEALCSGQPVIYTMLSHLFYPGAIITIEAGKALALRVKFPGAAVRGGAFHQMSAEEISRALGSAPLAPFTAYAFYEAQAQSAPVIIAATGCAANAIQAENSIDITFSRNPEAKPRSKIHIFFPGGLNRYDFSAKPASVFGLAAVMAPGADPAGTVRAWLRMGLNEPSATDEYFQVNPGANIVRIFQVMRYAPPPGIPVGPPMVILPPQIGFAASAFRYPAVMPETTVTGMLSFSGPVLSVARTAAAGATTGGLILASYDLPLPPQEERGLIAVTASEPLRAMLNSHFGELATTTTLNGVNVFYKGRAQGFQAFSYLSEANRKRLLDNTAVIVPGGLRDSQWYEAAEPFSGLSFWWTYFIEGPYFGRFDQDWGNGLSLYGLHTSVKYRGDWELIAKNWDAVERMFSWFAVTDDWEWMRAANGIHGHGTGAGDCASAAYAGVLSYAKLARGAGRTEDYHHGLYAAARAALFLLNRFAYNDFAQQNSFKEPNSLVLGFHEGSGFLVGELNAYPWNVTSNISGNGLQPENFDLYLKYAPDLLREYEKTFEQAYPDWMDGSHKYNRRTLYRGNSGYITLPHIYLRARMEMNSFEELAGLLNRARTNDYLWWLAPPVIAEALNSRNDVYVRDWGRCAFNGGEISRDRKRNRKVELQFDNKYPPDAVEIAVPNQPALIQINGGPVPLTDSRYDNGVQWLKLRRPGANTITFLY
ncbi:MAG: hypothetical protein WCK47_05775 [bacterium]